METIFAPVTPLVVSSIIVVRISGENALLALKHIKKSDGSIFQEPKHAVSNYAHFVCSENVTDEILFTYYKSPKSYTGEDTIEISFHGNPLIVTEALKSFFSLGFRSAEPGEFTKRAFLNGKLDLTQAEAVLDLIESKTMEGVHYAYEQLRGSLKNEIFSIKNKAVDVASVIEAYVDFPDEELDEREISYIDSNLKYIKNELEDLIESYKAHKALKDGFDICIIGKPNVGKSSLLNAILKEERALVSDIPGTTRDYIDAQFQLNGIPVSIIDTAGLRFTDDSLESRGIERALERIKKADLIVCLLDMSSSLTEEDRHVLELCEKMNRVIIGNKADLNQVCEFNELDLKVSIKNNEDIKNILNLLKSKLVIFDSEHFSKNIVISERQKINFTEAYNIILDILSIGNYNELDIMLFEMGRFMNIISEITGESYTEEILDNIFSNFCIGK